MHTSSSIPINYLRQYIFCERIPYFKEIYGLKQQSQAWMKQGVDHHTLLEKLHTRRTLKRYDLEMGNVINNCNLFSESYGIHGNCDLLIETIDEVVPIEVKLGRRVFPAYVTQLIAYGLIAEERYDKEFQVGFLLLGEKGKEIKIESSVQERFKVIQIIESIKESFENSLLPDTSASEHQCGQCEYINFCNDRF